jgi:hypothetical protein
MTPAPSYLQNNEAVMEAFGYWPSFHDAPVIGFWQDTTPPGTLELEVHGWEMTQEVDARGYFKLIKHHLVRFRFLGISEAELDQFTSGNILFGLRFSTAGEFKAEGKFKVTMDSAMGSDLSGAFSARSGEVVEVAPCDNKGNRNPSSSAAGS